MTTTFKDVTAAIIAQLEDNITSVDAGYAAADVRWPGVHFKPGTRNDWMGLDVVFAETAQSGLAAPNRFIAGYAQISLFQRVGKTTSADILTRMDNARDLFKMDTTLTAGADSVRFREPLPMPQIEEGEWVHQPLRCEFYLFTT